MTTFRTDENIPCRDDRHKAFPVETLRAIDMTGVIDDMPERTDMDMAFNTQGDKVAMLFFKSFRFKTAMFSLVTALTLLFPQTSFTANFRNDHAGEEVKEFAGKDSGKIADRQSDGESCNESRSGVRVDGKIDGVIKNLRVHVFLMFVKCGFWAGLITGTAAGIYLYFRKFARRFFK